MPRTGPTAVGPVSRSLRSGRFLRGSGQVEWCRPMPLDWTAAPRGRSISRPTRLRRSAAGTGAAVVGSCLRPSPWSLPRPCLSSPLGLPGRSPAPAPASPPPRDRMSQARRRAFASVERDRACGARHPRVRSAPPGPADTAPARPAPSCRAWPAIRTRRTPSRTGSTASAARTTLHPGESAAGSPVDHQSIRWRPGALDRRCAVEAPIQDVRSETDGRMASCGARSPRRLLTCGAMAPEACGRRSHPVRV